MAITSCEVFFISRLWDGTGTEAVVVAGGENAAAKGSHSVYGSASLLACDEYGGGGLGWDAAGNGEIILASKGMEVDPGP